MKMLKPSRNKKGLTFVGMLVFESFFLNSNQLPAAKKIIQKSSIPTKVRSFLFREGFN